MARKRSNMETKTSEGKLRFMYMRRRRSRASWSLSGERPNRHKLVRGWKYPGSPVSQKRDAANIHRRLLARRCPRLGGQHLFSSSRCPDEIRENNYAIHRLSRNRDFADGMETRRGGKVEQQTTQAVQSRRIMGRRAARQTIGVYDNTA